jgi:phage replication O-like protein O
MELAEEPQMANPQAENGHIDIANDIADKLCAYRLSGEEWQVLWTILRKTYGWHKKEDHIGLGQFSVMTGLSRSHAKRAIKKLQDKNVIGVSKKGDSGVTCYNINKDFDKWKVYPKKDTVYPILDGGVPNIGQKVYPKKGPTKETIQKKIQKKAQEFFLPDFIPQETWSAYLAVREKKRAAKTPYAFNLIIKELEKIKSLHGHDPVEVLNQSIKSGWTDVYPLKQGLGGGNVSAPRAPIRDAEFVPCPQCKTRTLAKDLYLGKCPMCNRREKDEPIRTSATQ